MTDKTLREAAEKALEALEQLQGLCTDSDDSCVEAVTIWTPEAIEGLRAALASSPEQAGPVRCDGCGKTIAEHDRMMRCHPTQPVAPATDAGRIAELEAELSDKEVELEQARTWPQWADQILKTVREYSGYDGFDDAAEGVDLPEEVRECLAEFAGQIERLESAAKATPPLPQGEKALPVDSMCVAQDVAFEHAKEHDYLPQTWSDAVRWKPHAWVLDAMHAYAFKRERLKAAATPPPPAAPEPRGWLLQWPKSGGGCDWLWHAGPNEPTFVDFPRVPLYEGTPPPAAQPVALSDGLNWTALNILMNAVRRNGSDQTNAEILAGLGIPRPDGEKGE